jgi:hypothetical protein
MGAKAPALIELRNTRLTEMRAGFAAAQDSVPGATVSGRCQISLAQTAE